MIVLTHGDCTDGMCAAWIAHRKYPGATFYSVNYGKPMPVFPDNKTVIIADFSYPPEELVALAKRSKQVIVLDHHISTIKATHDYFLIHPMPANLTLKLDLQQSGAGLVWRHFYPTHELPWLVKHVEDRDLRRFHYSMTEEIMAYVMIQPFDFAAWDSMSLMDPAAICRIGEVLLVKEARDAQWHLQHACFSMEIAGYKVPCVNAPRYLASKLGIALAYDQPFSATYYEDLHHRYFSLRSDERNGIDVSLIAEQYKGGGHRDSAGFIIEKCNCLPDQLI